MKKTRARPNRHSKENITSSLLATVLHALSLPPFAGAGNGEGSQLFPPIVPVFLYGVNAALNTATCTQQARR